MWRKLWCLLTGHSWRALPVYERPGVRVTLLVCDHCGENEDELELARDKWDQMERIG